MTSNRPYLLRAIHAWICDNGLTPYIVVNAATPGVRVPPQAVSEGRIVLNLAPRAVTQLDIGNDVIVFRARFGGVSQLVEVPLAAVQAIYARENGQGMLLAEDPPGTAAATLAAVPPSPGLQAVPEPVTDIAADGEPVAADTAADESVVHVTPRPKGKPTLHVVK